MKAFLIALALATFAALPAAASTITVDGDIGDWQALGLVHTDNITPYPLKHDFNITSYGAMISGGTLYAFIEVDRDVSEFKAFYPGIWINADRNTATELNGMPGELRGFGIDIEVERDSDGPPGLNFWGADGDVTQFMYAVPGGAYAEDGRVFEWSAPVSAIRDAIAGLPDAFQVPTDLPWTVYLAGEGSIDGGWGRDVAGPLDVVPEPCTPVLLVAGLAGLLAYAWRKRK
jgi:hypothetical protein